MFGFWDWVGGRYSFDSAIGFSLMVAIGPDAFADMLAGFHAIDRHFVDRAARGQPAGHPGHAQRLVQQPLRRRDPRRAPLQPAPGPLPGLPAAADHGVERQVGAPRRVAGVGRRPGRSSGASRAPTASTPSTSSSTRGPSSIPADFIGFAESTHEDGDQQDLLMANCFAQSKVLAFGRTAEEVAADGTPPALVPHKVMPGNHPTLDHPGPEAHTVGARSAGRALRAHGVHRGGGLGHRLVRPVGRRAGQGDGRSSSPRRSTGAEPPDLAGQDSSTAALVRRYRAMRGRPNLTPQAADRRVRPRPGPSRATGSWDR